MADTATGSHTTIPERSSRVRPGIAAAPNLTAEVDRARPGRRHGPRSWSLTVVARIASHYGFVMAPTGTSS